MPRNHTGLPVLQRQAQSRNCLLLLLHFASGHSSTIFPELPDFASSIASLN
jgi:hypothetical protein